MDTCKRDVLLIHFRYIYIWRLNDLNLGYQSIGQTQICIYTHARTYYCGIGSTYNILSYVYMNNKLYLETTE